MDKSNLVSIIGFVTCFVSLLLASFLLTVKTKNKLSNMLFASFLIFSAVDISGFFIFYFISDYPALEVFREQTALLIMPLFYLYALSACYSDFKLRPVHLLHLLPFLVANLVVTPGFYLADDAARTFFFENFSMMPENIFIRVFTDLQFAFYIVAVLLVLKKFKRIYLENYTNSSTVTYKWLFRLTMLSVAAHLIATVKNLLKYTDDAGLSLWAHLLVALIALFVLCWFVLNALHHPELFRGVDSKLKLVRDILPEEQKNQNQVPVEQNEEVQGRILNLKDYMTAEEPFLEPSLTVQDLANQMNMQVRELSILINHHLDQHFFDFINEYRISKAMKLLKDTRKAELTVLEILYQVGFNSKSSFNTAFKKHTGLTPSVYRNNSL